MSFDQSLPNQCMDALIFVFQKRLTLDEGMFRKEPSAKGLGYADDSFVSLRVLHTAPIGTDEVHYMLDGVSHGEMVQQIIKGARKVCVRVRLHKEAAQLLSSLPCALADPQACAYFRDLGLRVMSVETQTSSLEDNGDMLQEVCAMLDITLFGFSVLKKTIPAFSSFSIQLMQDKAREVISVDPAMHITQQEDIPHAG